MDWAKLSDATIENDPQSVAYVEALMASVGLSGATFRDLVSRQQKAGLKFLVLVPFVVFAWLPVVFFVFAGGAYLLVAFVEPPNDAPDTNRPFFFLLSVVTFAIGYGANRLANSLVRSLRPREWLIIDLVKITRILNTFSEPSVDGEDLPREQLREFGTRARNIERELTHRGVLFPRRYRSSAARERELQQRSRAALEVASAEIRLLGSERDRVAYARWIVGRVYVQTLWLDWSVPALGLDLPPEPGGGYRAPIQVLKRYVAAVAAVVGFGIAIFGFYVQFEDRYPDKTEKIRELFSG